MIEVVLFDADGVVTPSKRFSVQLQEDFNIPIEQSKLFFQNQFQDCLIGKSTLRKELPVYLKKWNWTHSLDDFLKYWFESSRETNEAVLSVVKKLRIKGIICCVATNQESERAEYMKQKMKFDKIFDKTYSSAELGTIKPMPEFFDKIISDLRVDKRGVLFWDDSKVNVDAANLYGINGVVFNSDTDMMSVLNFFGIKL